MFIQKFMSARRVLLAFSLVGAVTSALGQLSQAVKIVVPYTGGSGTDTVARLIAEELTSATGNSYIVENKAGAGGMIGTQLVARSPADGKTLTISSSATHSSARFLYPALSYDEQKDFTHIIKLVEVPFLLVINSNIPAKNLAEFINYARSNPGKMNFGYGSATSQIMAATFNREASIDALAVGYKSQPPAVIDLLGERVHYMFAGPDQVTAHITSGKLRALAVTTSKRIDQLNSIPTLAEAGFPSYDLVAWQGLSGPAGLPDHLSKSIELEVSRILAKPEVVERFKKIGFEVAPLAQSEFVPFVRDQIAVWGKRVEQAGLTVRSGN